MNIPRLASKSAERAALAALCAAAVLASAGCAAGSPSHPSGAAPAAAARPIGQPSPGRGSVLSVTPVEDLSAQQVATRLAAAGIDASRVRYGVRAERIVYRTVDTQGRPTTASELVALPKDAVHNLSTVSWLHGTEVYRGAVASVDAASTDRATVLLFSSTGRAVSAPDYLGLGKGPGIHPYGSAKATVSASVDALRAARTSARRHGRTLKPRVLVSGFSQGGPATMLLGRALQHGADAYFRPGALAPVAGPFDLSAFEAGAADDKAAKSSLYLAYFVTAWNRMYHLYDSPEEAFRAPYDKEVEQLFDGDHTGEQIALALPATSKALFTEAFLEKMRHPTGELRRRLKVMDDTCNWHPEVPVRLFHSKDDKDVAFTNSRHCARQLSAHTADERLIEVTAPDHSTTVLKALPQILREFDTAT
ncbi:hypothetical protein [Streptomyces sp. NPDC094031]|uniref:hypothetical protein n=1 Tax=Streptomyces sp. NPDC094031 TaxID=3155307 RepID=UPI003328C16C